MWTYVILYNSSSTQHVEYYAFKHPVVKGTRAEVAEAMCKMHNIDPKTCLGVLEAGPGIDVTLSNDAMMFRFQISK